MNLKSFPVTRFSVFLEPLVRSMLLRPVLKAENVSVSDVPDVGPNGKPFSCEKCHSPFIVNPARRHKPDSKRKYRPRKVTDLVTKQVLLVCNACGLSMVRSKKERHKKVCLCHKTASGLC